MNSKDASPHGRAPTFCSSPPRWRRAGRAERCASSIEFPGRATHDQTVSLRAHHAPRTTPQAREAERGQSFASSRAQSGKLSSSARDRQARKKRERASEQARSRQQRARIAAVGHAGEGQASGLPHAVDRTVRRCWSRRCAGPDLLLVSRVLSRRQPLPPGGRDGVVSVRRPRDHVDAGGGGRSGTPKGRGHAAWDALQETGYVFSFARRSDTFGYVSISLCVFHHRITFPARCRRRPRLPRDTCCRTHQRSSRSSGTAAWAVGAIPPTSSRRPSG